MLKVDCEMTGLNVVTDKLLEIAVIVTEGDTLATVDSHPEVQGEQHSLPGEAWVGSFLF